MDSDKRPTLKSANHPPIPPQRPGSVPIVPAGNKGNISNMFSNMSVNEDPGHSKDRGFSAPGYRAPMVDRSRKPALDQSASAHSERDSPSIDFAQRPLPRPVDSALNANTFPYRTPRPGPKPSFSGGNQLPLINPESLSPSGSLPPRFQQETMQSFTRGPSESRPPLPLPVNKGRPILPAPQDQVWKHCSIFMCVNV
ncbi:hypothetical protein scyTo_0017718 [Scyliorhinus torazame]|uniref:Uncharacterized protein n=1 Tax=Scyliorhinus torazame TaxID=75743 RepID=A0A401PYK5_SCYTO|nr:hypothetical protein [Scyliorhinus torazame]